MVRLTDCLDMTIVVDRGVKPKNKQTNKMIFAPSKDWDQSEHL